MGDLIKFSAPLLAAGYAFSQVLGKLLASQDNHVPPPTYYINDPDPSSPTPPGNKAPSGQAYTPVATLNIDQVLGNPIPGTGFGILVGPGLNGVALAVASPATSGNPTIICGPGLLPLAGVGQSTSTGAPIVDGWDEGVHMAMPMSHNASGKHTIYTAQGTLAQPTQNDPGCFPVNCALHPEVTPYYNWTPVDYPAELFPMAPGIDKGIKDLIQKISGTPGTFALVGYSQGAIITCKVWRDEILNPAGQLHDRLGDIFAHVTFGNPMRCPGIANGNGLVPIPVPVPLEGYVTGGIAGPDDLTPWQTPPWMMDFAHDGDMYAACPVGADPWANESPVGEAETSIYNIMMLKFFGQDTITAEVGQLLTNPIPTMVAIIEGLINTIGFFANNQTPHTSYGVDGSFDAAVRFLRDRGKNVPA
ncbi:MAG: hypothetical protein QM820_46285 [Minicystis sp.]